MKTIYTLLFALLVLLQIQACNIINPVEKTPYFLTIDSVQLKSFNASLHGETSAKITDVWVYENNNLLGGFEVPARIPILADSGSNIDIQAGVLRNGIADDRLKYPYYKLESMPLNWAAGTTKHVSPSFTYVPFDQMKMYINEDFEIGNAFLPLNVDTTIQIAGAAKYGSKCGVMYLDATHKQSQNIHQDKLELLPNQKYYLEVDYKSDVPIAIDILCTSANGTTAINPLGGIKPKADWNKIYFDIGALVDAVRTKNYNVIISSYLPEGQTTGTAYIDNVKIVGPR
jgi:hypothetical protein